MKAAKIAIALLSVSLLAGCVGTRDHRGAVIDAELVSSIQVGVDNKDAVERLLGRPTFTSEFDANEWYYVSRDTKTVAFASPRLLDQTVLKITFDPAGNVASIQQTDEQLVARVNPVNDKTPTAGRQRTLWDDIFGNVGVVNSPATPGSGQPQ